MHMQLRYNGENNLQGTSILLPGSKSISNRYLILNALTDNVAQIDGLSESRDTQLLQAALEHESDSYWFEDGATPLRFFLAFAAATGRMGLLEGTAGLQARSVAPLAHALEQAGALFEYLQNPGFPPVRIRKQCGHTGHITVDRSASSQYVSALLLVAPRLSQKLHLQLQGKPNSDPYVHMTLKCLSDFGISSKFNPESNAILVDSSHFQAPYNLFIEPDWSAASYFYSLCACMANSTFTFPNLRVSGMQGDEKLQAFYRDLGVITEQSAGGLQIRNISAPNPEPFFDLRNQIDLAPAIVCTCAFLRLPATFTGLENLQFKESNRLQALNHNLAKFGCSLNAADGHWKITYGKKENTGDTIAIETFSDHRMAMAFSIFALSGILELDDAACVAKSFPGYWNELAKCNFVHHNFGQ